MRQLSGQNLLDAQEPGHSLRCFLLVAGEQHRFHAGRPDAGNDLCGIRPDRVGKCDKASICAACGQVNEDRKSNV